MCTLYNYRKKLKGEIKSKFTVHPSGFFHALLLCMSLPPWNTGSLYQLCN